MRTTVCLAALLLWATALCQTLTCGPADESPAIDGRGDDACWQGAMLATDFSVLGSGGKERAFRQTTVRAAFDQQALYIHAICLEPDPASVTAKIAERDGSVWLEDALELFVSPDPAAALAYHFIVNARGVLYDELGTDGDYNADVTVAAVDGDQAWQVEFAIPWGAFSTSAPTAGQEWGFNVGREHRPQEPQEWSTWAPLQEGKRIFGIPELFGHLRFAEASAPGRASKLTPPDGIVRNPAFTELRDGKPAEWSLADKTRFSEIAPMSGHYSAWNDSGYGIASQSVDIPVKAGDVFTVFAVARCSPDATLGIAAVQEMEDGRPDDLYPFWQMPGTDQYQLYSGRIVVDQGARRLFSLGLYRATKQGWVDYAYVQILPGLHGLSGIAEAARCTAPDRRGVGEPWATPSLSPYKPLSAGPLRALVFIGEFQRDAVELAQRLDIDYDLVYCPQFRGSKTVENVVAFDAPAVLRRLAAGEYGLIILAGKPSEQVVIDAILDSVRRGAGLVAVEPVAGEPLHAEAWAKLQAALPTEPTLGGRLSEVLGGLSPEVLAATSPEGGGLKAVACGDVDKGRIARLTWTEATPGLIPFARGLCEYWEYRWAAVAKAALWACRRQPSAQVASVVAEDSLHIRLNGPLPADATLSVHWDGRLGGAIGDVTVTPDAAGMATVPIPEELGRARGPAVARVLLSSARQPLDIAACVLPDSEPAVRLGQITVPETFTPGAPITVDIPCHADAPGPVALDVRIIDAFGRVVTMGEITTDGAGEMRPRIALAVHNPLSVYHRIEVRASDEQGVVDEASAVALCPEAGAGGLDDFALAAGYAAMPVRCPPHLEDEIVAFFRANGIHASTVNQYMTARGMPAWGGTVSGGMRHSSGEHARSACFSNPEEVAKLAKRTVDGVAARAKWGFVGYNMEDEVHLQQDGAVEVCNCEHCTAAFREWTQRAYGTIDAANAEWGTAYGGFGEITVPLVQEMKGQSNPARWVDFRLLMERVWANAYAEAHTAVREACPQARMSFTNPYRYNSLSGVDFSLWVPNEEVLLRYFHRHVVDRNKSWSHAPMLSWFGYESPALEVGRFVWWFAFNGGVMPIWWDPVEPWAYSGKEGYTAWNMLSPLWQETGRSQAVTAAAQDLQAGIGKVLRLAQPAPAEAVILHSQSSMHVLFAEPCLKLGRVTDDGYGRYRASDDALAAALKRRGLSYRYALPQELSAERLKGVQVLVLPSCVALSDETVAAIRAYVDSGGKVLADMQPATHDEHGKPRPQPALAALFAGPPAVCLSKAAGEGSGDELDGALASLQLTPAISWSTADGKLPQCTEMYRYVLGGAQYIGLVRDATSRAKAEGPLTLRLPAAAHVYDCRAGRYLGQLGEMTLDTAPADAAFLCLLPYHPEAMRVLAKLEGNALHVSADLAGVSAATDHVFRLEITPPGAAEPSLCYSRNLPASGGLLEHDATLALNDPAGRWTVTVRDIATGLSATAYVEHGEQ